MKARAWLSERDVTFVEREFFRQRLSRDEMNDLVGNRPAGEAFSWRGNAARAAGIEPGGRNDIELVDLMVDDPGYLRRPILRFGSEFVVGFDPTKWDDLVAKARRA